MSLFVDRDKVAKEGTPADKTSEPFSTSKNSNWVAKAGGLPNYIQHVAHAFVRKGMDESKAIGMAVGVVRNWSEGKGNVSPAVQAAAAKAIAQWEKMKASSHAKSAGEFEEIDVLHTPDELGMTISIFEKATMTTADFGGAGEAPLSQETGDACPECGGTTAHHKKGCPLAGGSGKQLALKKKAWGKDLKGGTGESTGGTEAPGKGVKPKGEQQLVDMLHTAIKAIAGKKKKKVGLSSARRAK